MKIRPVGGEFFFPHANGQTHTHDEVMGNNRSSQFCEKRLQTRHDSHNTQQACTRNAPKLSRLEPS